MQDRIDISIEHSLQTIPEKDLISGYISSCLEKDLQKKWKLEKEIYRTYSKEVYETCIYMVWDKELAKEITQDVFLKIYSKASTFKWESNLSAWIYSITSRTCLDVLKKRNLNTTELKCSDYNKLSNDAFVQHDFIRDYSKKINFLDGLSDSEKYSKYIKLLKLKYIEWKSRKELIKIFNVKESTIKWMLLNARKILQTLYEKQEIE